MYMAMVSISCTRNTSIQQQLQVLTNLLRTWRDSWTCSWSRIHHPVLFEQRYLWTRQTNHTTRNPQSQVATLKATRTNSRIRGRPSHHRSEHDEGGRLEPGLGVVHGVGDSVGCRNQQGHWVLDDLLACVHSFPTQLWWAPSAQVSVLERVMELTATSGAQKTRQKSAWCRIVQDKMFVSHADKLMDRSSITASV